MKRTGPLRFTRRHLMATGLTLGASSALGAPPTSSRGAFDCAQLIHGGNWNPRPTALRRLLDEVVNLSDRTRADAMRRMIEELIPDKVPIDLLLSVLRLLLEERVSIRNLPLILEAIAEVRNALPSPEAICEHVRQRLGFQLVAEMRREDGTIPLLQLAPEWEQTFSNHQIEGERQQSTLHFDALKRLLDRHEPGWSGVHR